VLLEVWSDPWVPHFVVAATLVLRHKEDVTNLTSNINSNLAIFRVLFEIVRVSKIYFHTTDLKAY
jgi:hypothetical protein